MSSSICRRNSMPPMMAMPPRRTIQRAVNQERTTPCVSRRGGGAMSDNPNKLGNNQCIRAPALKARLRLADTGVRVNDIRTTLHDAAAVDRPAMYQTLSAMRQARMAPANSCVGEMTPAQRARPHNEVGTQHR